MLTRSNILLALKIATLICALAILVISIMPSNAGIRPPTMNDKINHIIGYSVLTGLGVLSWKKKRRTWFLGFVFVMSGGVEILQANMDFGRDGSWGDMIANMIGIGIGLAGGHTVVLLVRRLSSRMVLVG
ncbi:MAG: hypothetical protein AAFX02_10695 [Pseudomonadota bacterium]